LLAKDVNDDAVLQVYRGVLKFFASKLAPTKISIFSLSLFFGSPVIQGK